MEMPEGWKKLRNIKTMGISGGIPWEESNNIAKNAANLMKEMAEALEGVTADLINCDNHGIEEARDALNKFKEWK